MSELQPIPNDGSKCYTPLILLIYDWLVIHFSNPLVWRCPTPKILLPFFMENFSERHLDIGVGNGYFPTTVLTNIEKAQGGVRRDQHITLVDLNPNSLVAAKQRIWSQHPEVDIRCVLADAAKPMPRAMNGARFDSASLYLLLHCMPGPTVAKTQAFAVAKQHLTDDGVLFGATILGKEWEKVVDGYRVKSEKLGWLTSLALGRYNKWGIFNNLEEDPQVFENVLRNEFEELETRICGMMFLFKAKKPRKN